MSSRGWVVLKFGGTSVSTVERWNTIAEQARARFDEGLRPLVVCSALSGVSDLLDKVALTAPQGLPREALNEIVRRHEALAAAMGIELGEKIRSELAEIERLALGVSLVREVSPRVRARIMAGGELLSTLLGAAFLGQLGFRVGWLDARELLVAENDLLLPESRRFLSATCRFERDPALLQRLGDLVEPILVTQGFIASDASGGTVLLGRGGSDTSATIFAAKLGAVRCEIWTDVPGMYTANPRQVPQARLLRALHYDEAQEMASTGAKVLHPRCIAPVREHGIPLLIRSTEDPTAEGTTIGPGIPAALPQVKSISSKRGVTLVTMDTIGMWQQVGFLADVFSCFKKRGLSIDLVSTSESNVTVSLESGANVLDSSVLACLVSDLSQYCQARTLGPCAAVSLVGRDIRALLHRLGPALRAFEEHRIYLVSQAANDLNLTFVLDENQADRLVSALHGLLFDETESDSLFGPPLMARPENRRPVDTPWWRTRRDDLLALATGGTPLYVYDAATLDLAAKRLLTLRPIERVLFAVKANPHRDILAGFARAGLGFECVSPGEVDAVFAAVPGIPAERILFTPNFCGRNEFEDAFARGIRVTVDNLYPLENWPRLFRDRPIFLRLDPGEGRGHHRHVHTGGTSSKFGVPKEDLGRLQKAVAAASARVVGLHAHVGSGILAADNWAEIAVFLADAASSFPDASNLDLGGGLGVAERPGQAGLDLVAVESGLLRFRAAHPRLSLWMEPGRFLVAEAGVLLGRVTQQKQKGSKRYVGVDIGMNSLIRPALYGAHHDIVNLTRLDEAPHETVTVVGPICESADVLGFSRRLPRTEEGDVLLIATVGAYGHSMASNYNLRPPAHETVLPKGA